MTVTFLGRATWRPDPQTGLYEFELDDGRPVRLHDTCPRAVQQETTSIGQLVILFEYHPDWIPKGLESTPFVEFRFTGVRNVADEQFAGADDLEDNVRCFDHIPPNRFWLDTTHRSLVFDATAVELTLR